LAPEQPAESTVYFLGAGASAASSDDVVLTANLLEKALARSRGGPGTLREAVDEARAFNALLSGTGKPLTADQLFSLIEVCLAEELSINADWPVERLQRLRESLLHLIYNCVQSRLHPTPRKREWVTRARAFAERLRNAGRIRIVSLNWDCIIDQALVRASGRDATLIDYGGPFSTADGSPLQPAAPDVPLLLKPHGSVSWGYCHVCRAVCVDLEAPFQVFGDRPCPRPHRRTNLQPVLVPPAPHRSRQPHLLHGIWDRAEQELAACRRLVVIGYSLPPDDNHVRARLVRALARFGTRDEHERVEVVVVDRKTAAATVRPRFQALLGGLARLQFHFLDGGMAEWLSREDGPTGVRRRT
jgi:hypothetical protein